LYVENGPTLSPGTTIVRYSIHKTVNVTLDLVDLFGTPVATFHQRLDPAGIYEMPITIPDVASGNYFLRLQGSSITVAPLSIVQ
jgi:hypothetical protein